MNGNILMLPGGSKALAVREIDDPDLYVNLVERHPGHVQRRKDRKDAMRRKAVRAREDRDQQMRDMALVSQFSALGVLVVLGLAL
jgi:hypothetical protein